MAVLPFRPIPFFANKNRAFWRLQAAGWGGALLLRAASGLANGQPLSFLVLVLISTITGLSITLILSVIYRQLMGRRPLVTWGVTALVMPLAVALYAFIDAWVNGLYAGDSGAGFAQRFIGLFYLDATLLLAWSALYYMINFFLQIEEQNDQLMRLENQATQAQLAMLRYQLNPHFLFNTLNSISTLVLLKQTEPANAMLSRLSSFLRYTLVNEPTGRVTVAQEDRHAEALSRYRADALRRAAAHPVPGGTGDGGRSAALTVAPAAGGKRDQVCGQPAGGRGRDHHRGATRRSKPSHHRLRYRTGLQSGASNNRLTGVTFDGGEQVSTGVGLANIRDRLAQAYGEDHRFETMEPAEGGFAVLIEIPFERREAAPSLPAQQRPALAG
jgi:two-component system, LytTR family, sensor kinase